MSDTFNPVDPPAPDPVNPLVAYAKPPAGMGAIAAGQIIIAMLLLLSVTLVMRPDATWTSSQWTVALYPVGLFIVAGIGLALRHGWGWWLTCTIYFHAFFSVPATLTLALLKGQPFTPGNSIVILGLSVLVLGYLNRREALRFIRFAGADGRPSRVVLISPLIVGATSAVLRFIAEFAAA